MISFLTCPVCGRYHPAPLNGWWCPFCGESENSKLIRDLNNRLTIIEKSVEWGTELTELEE